MELDQDLACQYCSRLVPTQFYQIHQFSCLKKHQKVQNQKPKSQQFQNFFEDMEQPIQQEMEWIPCNECGNWVAFSQFANHYDVCPGMSLSRCSFCNVMYPKTLMNEHSKVCQIKNMIEQQQIQTQRQRERLRLRQQERQIQRQRQRQRQRRQRIYRLFRNNAMIQGMKQQDVKKLKQVVASEAHGVCAVCYCDIQIKDILFDLDCGHKFHTQCLQPWLEKNNRCPLCRKQVLQRFT